MGGTGDDREAGRSEDVGPQQRRRSAGRVGIAQRPHDRQRRREQVADEPPESLGDPAKVVGRDGQQAEEHATERVALAPHDWIAEQRTDEDGRHGAGQVGQHAEEQLGGRGLVREFVE
jgi:hypothetical protein